MLGGDRKRLLLESPSLPSLLSLSRPDSSRTPTELIVLACSLFCC